MVQTAREIHDLNMDFAGVTNSHARINDRLFVCLFVSTNYKTAEPLSWQRFENFANSQIFAPDRSTESHMGLHTNS